MMFAWSLPAAKHPQGLTALRSPLKEPILWSGSSQWLGITSVLCMPGTARQLGQLLSRLQKVKTQRLLTEKERALGFLCQGLGWAERSSFPLGTCRVESLSCAVLTQHLRY